MDDLTWLFKEKYKKVFEKLYKRHLEISKNTIKKPLPYSVTSLADDLGVSKSAITQTLKPFREHGLVEARTKYIDLTEEGLVYWRILTTPLVSEVKQVILDYQDEHYMEPDPSKVAAILGKNPCNQAVMNVIYAVLARDDVKKARKRRFITVGSKEKGIS